MKYIFSFALVCALSVLCSCGSGKNETQPEENPSELSSDTATTELAEDTTSINDEDHGDPGMNGLIIDPENLEADVKAFLYSLTREGLTNLVEKNVDVLHIKPGPGVSPLYSFIPSSKDLTTIEEFALYLSDTAHVPSTYYRMVHDPCEIMNGLPEGTYVRDYDFKDLSFTDDGTYEKLQPFTNAKQSESGVELFINFKTKTDEQAFLHLFTLRGDGKLVLVIVDQRDCGA